LVNKLKKAGLVLMLIILTSVNLGCQNSLKAVKPENKADKNSNQELVKVQIHFTDNKTLTAYVKGLGINADDQIYSGGASLNYYYDKDGKVLGGFNYQRVLYMQIIPEETAEPDQNISQ